MAWRTDSDPWDLMVARARTASAPEVGPALELLRESIAPRSPRADVSARGPADRQAAAARRGPGGDQHAGTPTVSRHHAADGGFAARARASSIGLLEERTAHERRPRVRTRRYKVNSLTGLDRASAVEGEVVWDPVRSIWITGMFRRPRSSGADLQLERAGRSSC